MLKQIILEEKKNWHYFSFLIEIPLLNHSTTFYFSIPSSKKMHKLDLAYHSFIQHNKKYLLNCSMLGPVTGAGNNAAPRTDRSLLSRCLHSREHRNVRRRGLPGEDKAGPRQSARFTLRSWKHPQGGGLQSCILTDKKETAKWKFQADRPARARGSVSKSSKEGPVCSTA